MSLLIKALIVTVALSASLFGAWLEFVKKRNATTPPPTTSTTTTTSTLPGTAFSFTEGFDTDTDIAALTPSRFTEIFLTHSENTAAISTEKFSSGKSSLRFSAKQTTDANVSKALVFKRGFEAKEGQVVQVKGDFYFPADADLSNVFLADLECDGCYKTNPGIRLVLNGNGYLEVERGKIGFRDGTFKQKKMKVPRDTWVTLTWVVQMGMGDKGRTQVFLGNDKVIDARGTTMPDPAVFSALGVPLTHTSYRKIDLGITANGSSKPMTMFVDNFGLDIN